MKLVTQRLKVLQDLGLGYLTLGEETPSLSGGEAQRLKLASEMGRAQHDTVFVFDEPTIGLHPLDVRTLLGVFRTLIENGATVIVIEHDLDVIRSADYLIDMGPGGGEEGGRVVACGTPAEVKQNRRAGRGNLSETYHAFPLGGRWPAGRMRGELAVIARKRVAVQTRLISHLR